MTTPATPSSQSTPLRQLLRIRPGQSQMLQWPAGTVVTPLRGGVWLSETPHWLGEQLVRSRIRVEAHATHVMAGAGWVVLWAEHEAVLQVLPGVAEPAGFDVALRPAWATLAEAWRKTRQRFARGPARLAG